MCCKYENSKIWPPIGCHPKKRNRRVRSRSGLEEIFQLLEFILNTTLKILFLKIISYKYILMINTNYVLSFFLSEIIQENMTFKTIHSSKFLYFQHPNGGIYFISFSEKPIRVNGNPFSKCRERAFL